MLFVMQKQSHGQTQKARSKAAPTDVANGTAIANNPENIPDALAQNIPDVAEAKALVVLQDTMMCLMICC